MSGRVTGVDAEDILTDITVSGFDWTADWDTE